MNDMRLVITIVRRDQGEEYMSLFKRQGVSTVFTGLCRGTASKSMLDYLGIERSEKYMLQAVMHGAIADKLLTKLYGMGLSSLGGGIALTVPVSSIGGMSCLNYLTKGQKDVQREVKKMSEYPYALIVVIADKGNTDLIMDAARAAGAKGGTVMGAKGTADGASSKFFGMSIAEEKEIIYIAAKKSAKDEIMKAVMKNAGISSDAHTVLFSLPIEDIAGFAEMKGEDEA